MKALRREDEYKFVGTTRDCLIAYGKTLPTGSLARSARKPMADYTRKNDRAAYRWINGRAMPIGENLVSCRIFLERQGYFCEELASIDSRAFFLAQLIYDDKVTFDDARQYLGLKTRDAFLALLVGREKLSSYRHAKWDEFLRPYKAPQCEPEVEALQDKEVNSLRHQATLSVLAHQIQAMEPVAMYLLTDKFTDLERRELRKMVPNDGLQKLARKLLALCSKEARKIFMSELIQTRKGTR